MKIFNQYITLYASFVLLLFLVLFGIDALKEENVALQKHLLVKEARTHFQNQVLTRKWSAQYGGVYVKPKNGLEPNPYLINNTLQSSEGEELIKINPAWMTRQLSELSSSDDYHFRIVSLDPLNPKNAADEFEKRALEFLYKEQTQEYYELNEEFRYMGALKVTQACLECHAQQGYKLGDIRGGISIDLGLKEYQQVIDNVESRAFIAKLLISFLLFVMLLLIHKQLRSNEDLKEEVEKQTKEIQTTKQLLQQILDTDRSFLMVSKEERLIFANKTMLDFFDVATIEEFFQKYEHISNFFLAQDKNALCSTMDSIHWISYLHQIQSKKDIKIYMKDKNGEVRCFRPHLKEVLIDTQNLNIIIFNDITDELQKINSLEEKASTDALTNLFNKGKFNDVVAQEMELAKTTQMALSLIFLDIDHFKKVNDTYGHDIGDYVLKEIAKILTHSVRKGDFVARWGGEEFIITLQAITAEQAFIVAEKIRHNVEEYTFTDGGRQTISLGVTQYLLGEKEEQFLKRVDEALYEAKATGRNRVVIK